MLTTSYYIKNVFLTSVLDNCVNSLEREIDKCFLENDLEPPLTKKLAPTPIQVYFRHILIADLVLV